MVGIFFMKKAFGKINSIGKNGQVRFTTLFAISKIKELSIFFFCTFLKYINIKIYKYYLEKLAFSESFTSGM